MNSFNLRRYTKKKAVEPFYTTKDFGNGTGLGLSVVDGIINQHGGFLLIKDSEVGGTKMEVYLPWVETTVQTELSAHEKVECDDFHATVLFAEDEPELLEMIASFLSTYGFTILTAANGQDALDLFKEKQSEIDVILTDVIMPKLGGKELFHAIRDIDPSMGCVFMSGYSKAELTEKDGHLPKLTTFISKPCNFDELVRSLRDLSKKSTNTLVA